SLIPTKIHARIASNVFKMVAPKDVVGAIETNAILNNLVGIGNPCNYAFPAMQINLAPAVADEACEEQGLKGMGFFGSPDGHRDVHDSAGGITIMIANSDIPEDYECGRFHLLAAGFYVKLTPGAIVGFSGLNKHGGTPPIAPAGKTVPPYAYRMMGVCYPPSSMVSGAGVHSIPLAGLPDNKLLRLGPEITTPRLSGTPVGSLSNEANWTTDGHIIMKRSSHMTFLVRSFAQLLRYITNQLPTDYGVQVDAQGISDAITFLSQE
ncbi:hypothetical protein BDN72DRAFT_719677, partial [Pluteus cervinus]